MPRNREFDAAALRRRGDEKMSSFPSAFGRDELAVPDERSAPMRPRGRGCPRVGHRHWNDDRRDLRRGRRTSRGRRARLRGAGLRGGGCRRLCGLAGARRRLMSDRSTRACAGATPFGRRGLRRDDDPGSRPIRRRSEQISTRQAAGARRGADARLCRRLSRASRRNFWCGSTKTGHISPSAILSHFRWRRRESRWEPIGPNALAFQRRGFRPKPNPADCRRGGCDRSRRRSTSAKSRTNSARHCGHSRGYAHRLFDRGRRTPAGPTHTAPIQRRLSTNRLRSGPVDARIVDETAGAALRGRILVRGMTLRDDLRRADRLLTTRDGEAKINICGPSRAASWRRAASSAAGSGRAATAPRRRRARGRSE